MGANSSVSEEAQAWTHGFVRQNVTYDSQISRTRRQHVTLVLHLRPRHAQGDAEADPQLDASGTGAVPSWSMMRWIQIRRTPGSGQFDRIAASFRGTTRWYARRLATHP